MIAGQAAAGGVPPPFQFFGNPTGNRAEGARGVGRAGRRPGRPTPATTAATGCPVRPDQGGGRLLTPLAERPVVRVVPMPAGGTFGTDGTA